MRYYEGHEKAYQKLRDKGCRSWDEYCGQAPDFETFCLKQFLDEMFARYEFTDDRGRALEVGCGTGPICCYLAKKGFEVEGIDISSTAIDIAREQAKAFGLSIRYRVADLCRDDLEQDQYDLVIDGHCMHCIVTEADRQRALTNIRSAIRHGGQFWIDTMIADEETRFGPDTELDEEGILWVKISKPGGFDLEKQVDDLTYVANRRVYRDPARIVSELEEAGFTLAWSNTVAAEKQGANGTFQAMCELA